MEVNKTNVPEGQLSGILLFKGEVKKSHNHIITFSQIFLECIKIIPIFAIRRIGVLQRSCAILHAFGFRNDVRTTA